ncbi:HAMP domain-containing protein [Pseudoduganella sp. FT93W]|uniref:histidine kinase n=1 Tax=Duganella fentianensis TaxID=2692177 RepID=A0A845I094_9BURK|nr:ATP-binding protein [Duganella fentianensis]MYN45225.1 HAMP domain-containing protein [Duganella fentianensis]
MATPRITARWHWGLPRLYIRFYVALLVTLIVFALAVMLVWHRSGGPLERSNSTLAQVMQNALASAEAPPAQQQAALEHMAAGLHASLTLYGRDWQLLAAVGEPIPPHRWRQRDLSGPPPESFVRLPDGRRLLSSVPLGFTRPKAMLHNALLLVALGIGVAAFPLVRHLTKRLERLQQGVDSLGAGNLTARVAVEGKDEVAQLARSFNRAADQIEQLVGAHKTLLANASHELRTPLARIRLALELLQDDVDPKRRAGLEQDIRELNALLDEILLASRLDAVNAEVSMEEVDLLALAAEECAHYDEAELDGVSAVMNGDARLLRRLLRNLLENARRHGAAPTRLQLRCADGLALLTVSDGGAGVPVSEAERVFEPFYRRHGTRDNQGAGLGLALVRQIARRHGGEARCTRLDDGRSGFLITLPLKTA